MKTKKIILDGNALSVSDICTIVSHSSVQVEVSKKALGKVASSHSFLKQNMTSRVIYGVNTGFGPMASHILAANQLKELQYNLVRSHAAGMGRPIPERFVLAAMIVRLNTLAKGYSGVSPELLGTLQEFINRRILPVIPEHGAVGTSGDLVQLAHIALALIGEGQVTYKGVTCPTKKILSRLGVAPYNLGPKEGLSLINGTSVMSGIGSLLVAEARQIVSLAQLTGAMALELVEAFDDSIAQKLHEVRPHAGQMAVAQHLRSILKTSKLLKKRQAALQHLSPGSKILELENPIQEVYSLRCIAQILGPALDAVGSAETDVSTEINSATDNPIVDTEKKEFLHGGNFHGDYIASAMDRLKTALVKLTMLSERRANFFLHQKINRRFPPFMNLEQPGLTLGLQGLQFVATSTTAHSQSLAYPHHLHSIPTNADNQDVVSMGTDAALMAATVAENARTVLAIESVVLCQAADWLKAGEKLAQPTGRLHAAVRSIVPAVTKDRPLSEELGRLTELLKQFNP